MAGNDFVIADPCASERLLLDRIARRRGTLMMRAALIFDGVPRLAVLVHQKQVDPFRVDAAVGVRILATQNFTQRYLRHHLPARIAADHDAVEFLEDARLASVEERLEREARSHDNPQLINGIRLLRRGWIDLREPRPAGNVGSIALSFPPPTIPFPP